MSFRGISISWFHEHRRSREVAEVVGVDPFFIRSDRKFLPLRYIDQYLMTRRVLAEQKPACLVVMQPPPVALLAVLPYVTKHQAVLIGDLHSGVFFDRKWRWTAKWVLHRLRRHGGAIVPNGDLAEFCREAGVDAFVCHGLVKPLERTGASRVSDLVPHSEYVLVPFTYASDEPVAELLDAARLRPEIRWVLTGKAPRAVRSEAPKNVLFTGFVSRDDYAALRLSATAILALTTRDSTMQSAGYEAIASGTPLVTVSTRVLRQYFEDGAEYVENTAESIARGTARVLSSAAEYRARMIARRGEIMVEQEAVRGEISGWLNKTLGQKRARAERPR